MRNEAGMARVAVFLLGLPAQHLDQGARRQPRRWPASAATTLAIWMDRNTDDLHPHGRRGRDLDRRRRRSPTTQHIFQNLGDGTYFHSGCSRSAHAVAANVNITYKILYNDAVAMTGGQPHRRPAHALRRSASRSRPRACSRIVVVSDEPRQIPDRHRLGAGRHRSITATSSTRCSASCASVKGVSVLIYDQTCAAEKRRRRKRGTYPDPAKRVFINEAVCEGCGDCSAAVELPRRSTPVETEFGRKRAIDQSSCNKDFSCLNGFCPSFVTVEGGSLRKGKADDAGRRATAGPALPDARAAGARRKPYGMLITGIGGTGVVTIGAHPRHGRAYRRQGRHACSTMLGMAQKGGAVISHVRIGDTPEASARRAARRRRGRPAARLRPRRQRRARCAAPSCEARHHARLVNTHETITGEFTRNPDLAFPTATRCRLSIEAAAGAGGLRLPRRDAARHGADGRFDRHQLFMLGYAYQKGLIPLGHESIEQRDRAQRRGRAR